MTPVHLVSCVGLKAAGPCAARDLYRSQWFRKARAYVEAAGGPWWILSAAHGLVAPDEVIAPYECTLNAMHAPARRQWGARVVAQLCEALPSSGAVVLLAGERYRAPLLDHLGERAQVPMRGLGIGEQLAWFCERARVRG
jgi:hypothetical protein